MSYVGEPWLNEKIAKWDKTIAEKAIEKITYHNVNKEYQQ